MFGMEIQPPQVALNWLATEKDDDLCSTEGCSTDHDPLRQDHPYAELDRSQLKEMGTSRVYVQFRLRYTIVELKSHYLPMYIGTTTMVILIIVNIKVYNIRCVNYNYTVRARVYIYSECGLYSACLHGNIPSYKCK